MDRIIGIILQFIEWCTAICPKCGYSCEKRKGHDGQHGCYGRHEW